MRLCSNKLFHNMGTPPSYDLSHMNLSDNILEKHKTNYIQRKDLLNNYLKTLPVDKILHDNILGNKLNGEIDKNRELLMKILNNDHPIIKNQISINEKGDRLINLYNKYNDRKSGFPGANNILFQFNKNKSSLQIKKIFFDGLLYRLITTNKEYNTKHIESNMVIIKKKPNNLFSIRYNEIDKDNLDSVTWKKLDNIQDFSIKKNDTNLNAVIDDFDKEFYMYINNNTYEKIKENHNLMLKTDHSAALIGQKYSYSDEGTLIYYFRETGIGILECNRKKRIIVRIPTCKPFRTVMDSETNFNSDGFQFVSADISHHNIKSKNLEDKNIKINKGSPIRYSDDKLIIFQKEYPDRLINDKQCLFLEKIFVENNLTQYLNYTRIYNFFYLLYNQSKLEKIDTPPKKLSNNDIKNIKNVVGMNRINNFYWVKTNKDTYFSKGNIILPADHNGFDDIKDIEEYHKLDNLYNQYRFTEPLFEYFPNDSISSAPAYLLSIYKSDNNWYVDFITTSGYHTKIPMNNINITNHGLDLLCNIDYIIYNSKNTDNLLLSCKPYIIINCHTSGVEFKFTFNGKMDIYHFNNLKDGLSWVDTIVFNDKEIPLSEFITINEKLSMGSYIWDNNNNRLYWIPNVEWKFENFFFNNYELDIQSNILFMIQKENDKNGQTKKLLLDKISSKKKGIKLNKNDVSDIIKLLKND